MSARPAIPRRSRRPEVGSGTDIDVQLAVDFVIAAIEAKPRVVSSEASIVAVVLLDVTNDVASDSDPEFKITK